MDTAFLKEQPLIKFPAETPAWPAGGVAGQVARRQNPVTCGCVRLHCESKKTYFLNKAKGAFTKKKTAQYWHQIQRYNFDFWRGLYMAGLNKLRGVLSPVLTPFNTDYSISNLRFIEHCRTLIKLNVGLAIFGTNSEANSLSVNEKRQLLDLLVEGGLPAGKMMPGTGCCAISDSIELTRHAVSVGCAGVLMLPPFYYKGVSDEGLFRNFATVIDTIADSRLRIYLYHIPHVTQVGIGFDLIERLLKAYPGTVAGIKDSSGDWNNTLELLNRFQPDGFDVFAGSEPFLLQTLRHGGAGCITATGNVNAAAIAHLNATWNHATADSQQQKLNEVRSIFQRLPMIPAMKSAIAQETGDPEWSILRPPLVELTEDQARQLQHDLSAIDFHPNALGNTLAP